MTKPKLQIKVLCGYKCNQQCIYCDNPKTDNADFNKGEEVIDFVNKMKDKYEITLEADGGDALEYIPLLEQLLSLKMPIYIFTNGTMINEELIPLLHDKAIMRVSLDGIKEVHSVQRILKEGDDSFERTLNGINILQNYNIPFVIGTTITDLTIPHLNECYDFILGLNPKRWILTTQMFLNDPERLLTKEIYDKAEPIITRWGRDRKISFHSFHSIPTEPQIEVLFKANKIQVNIVGFDTPTLETYSYDEIDKMIGALQYD